MTSPVTKLTFVWKTAAVCPHSALGFGWVALIMSETFAMLLCTFFPPSRKSVSLYLLSAILLEGFYSSGSAKARLG